MNLANLPANCTPVAVQVEPVLDLQPALLVVKVEEQIKPNLPTPTLEEAAAEEAQADMWLLQALVALASCA